MLRTTRAGEPVFGDVRRAVTEIDGTLPLHDVTTMEALRAESIVSDRLSARLVSMFAGFGLLLAGIGIYGVTAHRVKQQTQEIGIRLALGADRSAVFRGVLGLGARLTAAGVVLGIAGAYSATFVLQRLVVDLDPSHLSILAGAAAVLATIALVACWMPAWRATRVDPLIVLRH